MPDDEDDAWLEQLREALASTADEDEAPRDRGRFDFAGDERPRRVTEPEPPAMAQAAPMRPEPGIVGDSTPGLAGIRDSLRALSLRMSAVESLSEDIARQSRRTNQPISPVEFEQIITRVVRTELPKILEEQLAKLPAAPAPSLDPETLDRWAARAAEGDAPAGEVVLLAHELRDRIAHLEELQRQSLEQLTADRRQLIDGAVSEIRGMLFGK
jgi:small-conductance mechanosensitive channel